MYIVKFYVYIEFVYRKILFFLYGLVKSEKYVFKFVK